MRVPVIGWDAVSALNHKNIWHAGKKAGKFAMGEGCFRFMLNYIWFDNNDGKGKPLFGDYRTVNFHAISSYYIKMKSILLVSS